MASDDDTPFLGDESSENSMHPETSRAEESSESANETINDDFDDENTSTIGQNACEHPYLGEMEQVRGRVIMDDLSTQMIPLLFSLTQVAVVPGQSFPVRETEETAINILRYAMENNHIFGIISPPNRDPQFSSTNVVGTTSEIIAYKMDETSCVVRAIGRQRFRVLRIASETINGNLIRFAYVKILPEITLQPVLEDAKLSSLDRIRFNHRFRCLRREASQMRWPAWLYRYHDEKYLVQALKKKLVKKFFLPKNVMCSENPMILSFQLLKTVAMPPKKIFKALRMNSSIQRLRWLLNTLESSTNAGKLKCRNCFCTVGYGSDIFAMSAEGPHGTYVNPSGYVHELITLRKVKNASASRNRETEFSWFPGYTWSYLQCQDCHVNLGWKFIACNDDLNPQEFWGISNDCVEIVRKGRDPPFRSSRLPGVVSYIGR